jgi:membrane-associated phospholipid phosphatase
MGSLGISLLRLPFAILNLLMAVSAISHGGHYLVDIIAGFVVAAAAIAAVLGITRGDRPTVLASPAVATN